MASLSLDNLQEKIPNKFNLVMVAAKRARQLKDGAPRLVATQSVNPVTIALEEIAAGKIVLDGSVARVMDDFGRPMAPAPTDRLDDLLALPGGLGPLDDSSLEELPSLESLLSGENFATPDLNLDSSADSDEGEDEA